MCARAVELVSERGGYLTVVVVVPRAVPWVNAGPHCTPTVTAEDRRRQAVEALEHAVGAVPPEIPLVTCIENGPRRKVTSRRVEIAQPDVVISRRRRLGLPRFGLRLNPVPAVAR